MNSLLLCALALATIIADTLPLGLLMWRDPCGPLPRQKCIVVQAKAVAAREHKV